MPSVVPAVAGKLGGRVIITLMAKLKGALVRLVYFTFHSSKGLLNLALTVEAAMKRASQFPSWT